MTAGDELYNQILAAPDGGDELYLIYADWLEERGDLARADLIRAQCTIAATPWWERRAIEASWRAESLLGQHGTAWRAQLPKIDGIEWARFDRGFVSTVHARDVKALYRHARAIRAAAPVSRVEMTKLDESVTPWVEDSVPWLRTLTLVGDMRHVIHQGSSIVSAVEHLEVLDVGDFENLEWMQHRSRDLPLRSFVIDGAHTTGLTFVRTLVEHVAHDELAVLHLGTAFVDYNTGYYADPTLRAEGAMILATAKLAGVEVLNVDRQRVGNEGFEAILEVMPHICDLSARGCELTRVMGLHKKGAMLESLDLSLNGFGSPGAITIASSPRAAKLASLELDTCEIAADGAAALAGSPLWSTLRYLDLSRNPLGTAGAAALAAAPRPAELHTLLLDDVDLDAASVERLVAMRWLRDLLELDLSGNALGPALAELRGLAVRKLGLGRTGLDVATAETLAAVWPQLVHANLARNPLGDAGLAAVVTGAAQLQTLDVGACELTDAGIDHLIAHRPPRLRSLILARNRPTIDGVRRLLASPIMHGLDVLDLSRCQLPPGIAQAVAEAPLVARLSTLNLRHNTFDEAGQLALARSPYLRSVKKIRLSGNQWEYSDAGRELLAQRFGHNWAWDPTDPEDEEMQPWYVQQAEAAAAPAPELPDGEGIPF